MRSGSIAACAAADEATLADGMRRAQEGDRAAYALVLSHCRDVFDRFARERHTAGASEEVVGRCLLTLHGARHTFDPGRSFAAWVEAIARHHGIGPDRDCAHGTVLRASRRAWIDTMFHGLRRGKRAVETG